MLPPIHTLSLCAKTLSSDLGERVFTHIEGSKTPPLDKRSGESYTTVKESRLCSWPQDSFIFV